MFSKISSILFLFLFLFSTHFFSRIFCQEFSLPKTSSQLREEGDKALREGDTKKAIHLYTEGIRIDPKDHHTFYKRAIVRLSTYQTQKALDDLNAVLELKPTFTQALKKKAKALSDLCQYEEAIKSFKSIGEQNLETSSTIEAQINSLTNAQEKYTNGISAYQQKLYDQTIQDLNIVLETSPDCIQARRILMHISNEKSDSNSAIEHATRLLHLQSDDRDALFHRGIALYFLGQNEAATNHFRECLKYDHDDKRCQKEFKKIRKLDKAFNEGQNLWNQNDFQRALEQFSEALEADLNNQNTVPQLYLWICKCYLKLKKADLAKEACTKALEKDDSLIDARMERGEANILLKDYDAAFQDFHTVTSKQPGNRQAQEALHRVQKLQKAASRKDYYKILGVSNSGTLQEIKKAYRQLCLEWHPDKHEDRELAEQKIVEINEAYEILSDNEKRDKYDRGEDLEVPNNFQRGGGFPFNFGGPSWTFHFN